MSIIFGRMNLRKLGTAHQGAFDIMDSSVAVDTRREDTLAWLLERNDALVQVKLGEKTRNPYRS